MLSPDWIVELVALVPNARQPLDGGGKVTVLPPAATSLDIDQSQTSKAIVPCSVKLAIGLRVGGGHSQQSPQEEFVFRGQPHGAMHTNVPRLAPAGFVRKPKRRLVDQVRYRGTTSIEWTEGMLHQGQLSDAHRCRAM